MNWSGAVSTAGFHAEVCTVKWRFGRGRVAVVACLLAVGRVRLQAPLSKMIPASLLEPLTIRATHLVADDEALPTKIHQAVAAAYGVDLPVANATFHGRMIGGPPLFFLTNPAANAHVLVLRFGQDSMCNAEFLIQELQAKDARVMHHINGLPPSGGFPQPKRNKSSPSFFPTPWSHAIAVLQRGHVVHIVPDMVDPRIVELTDGSTYLLMASGTPYPLLSLDQRNQFSSMWPPAIQRINVRSGWATASKRVLAPAATPLTTDGKAFTNGNATGAQRKSRVLYAPPWSHTPLRINGERYTGRIEKNWMPFPAAFNTNGSFLASQHLCPSHVVLKCDVASGLCARAHMSTSIDPLCARQTANPIHQGGTIHGGSNFVYFANILIGVAHVRNHGPSLVTATTKQHHLIPREYRHLLLRVSARAPYEIRNISHFFRLPNLFNGTSNAELDRIQFCSSAHLVHSPAEQGGKPVPSLRLHYGVGDCTAAQVDLPLALVMQMVGPGAAELSSAGGEGY